MAKKIATSKKLENDLFKIIIGTVDKKSPNVFYITLNCWVKKDIDYENLGDSIVNRVDSRITNLVREATNEYGFEQSITCIDCSGEGLDSGKYSYMTIDITILQKKYNTFLDVYNLASNFINQNSDKLLSILTENNLRPTKNKQK